VKIVAVTSCPTGIAHTYMAAEALESAGRDAGHEISVETQGSAGAVPLDPAVIAAADAVVFAADVEVRDRQRFAGKPTVSVSVKHAINHAADVIADAVAAAASAPAPEPHAAASGAPVVTRSATVGTGTQVRGWLMTGVSYLIPFVAAGGILIAFGFMLGGYEIKEQTSIGAGAWVDQFSVLSLQDWAGLMFIIGAGMFGFLNVVLAGYIAYAIADRPGLAPGFIAGWAAGEMGAGFLGAIVGGLTGGLIALWISRMSVPSAIKGVMPVLVIPLIATLLNGALMLLVVGKPLAWVFTELTDWLNSLSGTSVVLLGVLLGLMMAFDMGGPVNKVAYTFAITGLTAEAIAADDATALQVMATVMAAGMVPPLALALASVIRPKLFSKAERESGKVAWVLGASFITEGAIPFAAGDPFRVIPSIMAGSALTGGLVMLFGNELRAPHGGVWVFGLVEGWPSYILAVAAGTVLAAALVILLKSRFRSKDEAAIEAVEDTGLFANA
jgi:PTS system fructose-specific IIC component